MNDYEDSGADWWQAESLLEQRYAQEHGHTERDADLDDNEELGNPPF